MNPSTLFAMADVLGVPASPYYSYPFDSPRRGRVRLRPRGSTKHTETRAQARDRKKLERQRKRDARRKSK